MRKEGGEFLLDETMYAQLSTEFVSCMYYICNYTMKLYILRVVSNIISFHVAYVAILKTSKNETIHQD
jgi:hypothetical protein